MKFNIAKIILFASTISLAVLCIFAIIDNFNLAIHDRVAATIACNVTESIDIETGQIKTIRQCDSYNPQLVFYASIFLLIFDAIVFKHFYGVVNKSEENRREFLDFYKSNKNYNK